MTDTPFSTLSLTCKYGLIGNFNIYGRSGIGTIDYSAVSGTTLTSPPSIGGAGLEYLFWGSRGSQYDALFVESETASWGINKKPNTSMETLVGIDHVILTANNLRTKYRFAVDNFDAGKESQEKISSSTKYSLSAVVEYLINDYFRGNFELGMYLGDANGLIPLFGVGLGFDMGTYKSIGITGPTGATGPTGSTVPTGQPGSTGISGAIGASGPIGSPKTIGTSGPTGTIGASGAVGPSGITGTLEAK